VNLSPDPVLRVMAVSKRFGTQYALHDVSMEVFPNEIVGLVGENGAGKSTLLNIICGTITDYSGEVEYRGRSLRIKNSHDAALLGISRVFQEQALVPNIPVYENLFLSHESRFARFGMVNKRKMIAAAEEELTSLGLQLDVRRETGTYDVATRQALEIARACSTASLVEAEYPLILLDEPTASLTHDEIDPFFRLMEGLKEHASLVFVSHRLSETLAVCDRVYVLKDGRVVTAELAEDLDENVLHGLMVGRARAADFYKNAAQVTPDAEPVLVVENLTLDGKFHDVSFELSPGEILSVVGVLGAGKSELGECILGLKRPTSGTVCFRDLEITSLSLREHLNLGFAYVPAERQRLGIIGGLSGRCNISLSSIEDLFSRYGRLRLRTEKEAVSQSFDALKVRPRDPETPARLFSGGTQQPRLLGRGLIRSPGVLILDNPTAGVDSGAKEELYASFRELTANGVAILVISDDLLEAIGLGDRIAIMKDGRLTETVLADRDSKPNERDIVQHMV